MDFLDAETTAARLPYPALAESIREMAEKRRTGEAEAPPRTLLPLPEDGALLVMPASDGELAATKLVTVHPENPVKNLPTIHGEVVVMDAATGVRLGVLEGATVTARRTAALSLLAARTLAPDPGGPLLVVGAGAQGRAHLEAFREGLGTTEVAVVSRTPESARALADQAESLGMEARTAEDVREVLEGASLVVTATTSAETVLPEELAPGTFVAAVGAFTPEAAELPAALVGRSTVVVDTLEGAREEAGDLILAAEAGAFRWEDATQLEDALHWDEPPAGPVVFKSVGHALWDLAAARTAFAASL